MKPGKELDTLVAEKVMGLPVESGYFHFFLNAASGVSSFIKFSPTRFEGIQELPGRPMKSADFHPIELNLGHGGDYQFRDTKNKIRPYSTDIAAAWEVVGCGKFPSWAMKWDHKSKLYTVQIEYDGNRYFEQANAAPHAICLAALKAVGAL